MGITIQTGMGTAAHTPNCSYNPTGRLTCKERISSMESASQTGQTAAVSALDDNDDASDNDHHHHHYHYHHYHHHIIIIIIIKLDWNSNHGP